MSKFASDLAEELYALTVEGLQDEEFGDSEGFGWYALFKDEGVILSVDSQGFVTTREPVDVPAEWNLLRDANDWHTLGGLNESCDGLHLILNTARHGGSVPDFEDVVRHIESCKTCDSLGNFLEL